MKFNLKGVSTQTWIRTAILIIALVNQAVVMIGMSRGDINIEKWSEYATYILTTVSAIWSWWKNNSFTDPAQCADKDYNLNC